MMRNTRDLIRNRAGKPCNCGCKGRDPWHRASFRRVVRDVRREPVEGERICEGAPIIARETGRVRLPWGECEVSRDIYTFRGRESTLGWWVVRR